MVSSTGARLLDADAEAAYVGLLLPLAAVVTPNSREAAVLTGRPVDGVEGQEAAARALVALGAGAAVVKGGDQEGEESLDVLVDDGATILRAPRLDTANNHGTGCSFASAVAAGLARGDQPAEAVARAKAYVHAALARSAGWRLGAGHGPIDHLDLADPFVDRPL
jgi:hydroxymethylpyrimidine/phosphomethylpyrimidine kinase